MLIHYKTIVSSSREDNTKTITNGVKQMQKSILNRILIACAIIPMVIVAQTSVDVPWTGTPGEMETFIHGDTTETGEQAHDVYVLAANKVYLQLSEVNLSTSCELVGAEYADGEHPATVQPIAGDDGNLQFTGWPQNHVKTHGHSQTYAIRNILFNGVAAGQTGSLFGVLSTYGENNTVVVDHVTSVHHQIISYFNFGTAQRLHLTNNTAVQFTVYGGGMWWGGFVWGGGGGWTGTWKELKVQNNTVEGCHGQVMVIYDNGVIPGYNPIVIDHNTFVNITDWVKFYRHGNNTRFTNNLFVNTVSTGQTHNSHGQGPSLNWAGGHGKMATLHQGECTDSTLLARGWCWDNNNRNIHYNNNAFFDTEELTTMFNMEPWCWDVTDTNDVVTTYCDTMIGGPGSTFDYSQSRWMDDSTQYQMDNNGVSEADNIHATDLGFNLETVYIQTQVNRTMDWLDNKVHDTHPDGWWLHQNDEDWNVVEWPLPMTFSYSESSAAATHCTHGGPVGSTHHMTHAELGIDENATTVPATFALSQNYPNPFNPTTEISFTMDLTADVNLTIYNMLGQKVKVLENASLDAGTHTYTWNGQDELGQTVSTGVYLYTLTDGNQTISKKMALMK